MALCEDGPRDASDQTLRIIEFHVLRSRLDQQRHMEEKHSYSMQFRDARSQRLQLLRARPANH